MGVQEPEITIEDALLDALGAEVGDDDPTPPLAEAPPPPVEEEEVVDAGETTEEPEAPSAVEDEEEETQEEEEEVEQPEDAEEHPDEEGEESGDESTQLSGSTSDPAVLDLLSRYGGDVEEALKGQVELQRVLTRQGHEKAALSQRVQELEGQLQQATMFTSEPAFLTEEQQAWIEEAVQSGQPQAYIRQAVAAQEFALARAVVEQWSSEAPYPALRAGQMVDQAEWQLAQAQAPPEDFDRGELLMILTEHYPDLPTYEQQILNVMTTLGEYHPLVQQARNGTPEDAARGIVGLYEIARAQTTAVSTTRESVKKKSKEAARAARDAAVVSSSEASPAATQAPRSTQIAPGLTWEQYMEELDQ